MLRPSAANSTARIAEECGKKELKHETADIRGFTLMFEDANMEMKWNMAHLDRQVAITARYLFASAVFQGLFYWSDLEELSSPHSVHNRYSADAVIFYLGVVRLILGLIPLLGCFFVSAGLLIPTQMTIFWMNMCYGIPTLAIFYLRKPVASHWDSLFLIYGLCFFVLPKISPLNFIFGFSGVVVFALLFLYISSFRLNFYEWMLSTIMLTFISALFCYVSYSAERGSRERWLLKERLQREHIDLRIVASSIEDDLKRVSNDDRPFPLESLHYNSNFYNSKGRLVKLLASLGNNNTSNGTDNIEVNYENPIYSNELYDGRHANATLTSEAVGVQSGDLSSNNNNNSNNNNANNNNQRNNSNNQRERMALCFKGLAAWALCYIMGYAFDSTSKMMHPYSESGINNSAAFALLMHSMGFSSFLLYVTGQLRWLALNGLVSLAILYVFNQSGMDNKWVVFSTHSVGYIILMAAIVSMVLIFGGVVLVWSQLIDFLREVITKYPFVKDVISEDSILEQVLIQYIADMPARNNLFTSNQKHSLQVVKDLGPIDHSQGLDVEHMPLSNEQQDIDLKMKTSNVNNTANTSKSLVTQRVNKKATKKSNSSNSLSQSSSGKSNSSNKSDSKRHYSVSDINAGIEISLENNPNTCFVCQNGEACNIIRVCSQWKKSSKWHNLDGSTTEIDSTHMNQMMCRDVSALIYQLDELKGKVISLESIEKAQKSTIINLERLKTEHEATIASNKEKIKELQANIVNVKTTYENNINAIIAENNKNISDLKKQIKILSTPPISTPMSSNNSTSQSTPPAIAVSTTNAQTTADTSPGAATISSTLSTNQSDSATTSTNIKVMNGQSNSKSKQSSGVSKSQATLPSPSTKQSNASTTPISNTSTNIKYSPLSGEAATPKPSRSQPTEKSSSIAILPVSKDLSVQQNEAGSPINLINSNILHSVVSLLSKTLDSSTTSETGSEGNDHKLSPISTDVEQGELTSLKLNPSSMPNTVTNSMASTSITGINNISSNNSSSNSNNINYASSPMVDSLSLRRIDSFEEIEALLSIEREYFEQECFNNPSAFASSPKVSRSLNDVKANESHPKSWW